MRSTKFIFLFLFVQFFSTFVFAQNEKKEKLRLVISPYIFLPTFDARLRLPVTTGNSYDIDVKVKPKNYLEKLTMAAMLNFQIRKGKWSFIGDCFYYRLTQQDAYIETIYFNINNPIPWRPPIEVGLTLDAGSVLEMKSFQYTGLLEYQVVDSKSSLSVIAGMRNLRMVSWFDWNLTASINEADELVLDYTGRIDNTSNSWNVVAGVKGAISVIESERLKLIYLTNAGFGTSQFTWEAYGGLAFKLGNKVDLKMLYRMVQYYDDKVLNRLTYSGLVSGVSFYL